MQSNTYKGKNNVVADIMSRYPVDDINSDLNLDFEENLHSYFIEDEQEYEPHLIDIINYIKTSANSKIVGEIGKKIRNQAPNYRLLNNKLHSKS